MISAVAVLFAIGRQSTVVTSADLLKGANLSAQEKIIAGKHRWMLLGDWKGESRSRLTQFSQALAHWRAEDQGKQGQLALRANWETQLKQNQSPAITPITNYIVSLKDAQMPFSRMVDGKWTYIDKNSAGLAKEVYDSVQRRVRKPDLKLYLLLRKTDQRMIVYLSINDSLGAVIDLIKVILDDYVDQGSESYPSLGALSKSQIPKASLSDDIEHKPIKSANLDWPGIQNQGFLPWFQSQFLKKTAKPTAILADDRDLANYLRLGGPLEGYMNARGYRALDVGEATIIVPPFFTGSEEVRLRENDVAAIQPNLDSVEIINRDAQWVAKSGLQCDYDLMMYLQGSLACQRGIPELFLEIYPMLPTLQGIKVVDRSQKVTTTRLIGTPNGTLGNWLQSTRLGSNFEYRPSFPADENLGYYFGVNGKEQVESVSAFSTMEQRMVLPELSPLGMDAETASSNVTYYGGDWETIENTLGKKQVKLVDGEAITLTFRSTLGRTFAFTFFFQKSVNQNSTFAELPANFRDALRRRTEELLKERDEKTQPPPLSASFALAVH